MRYQEFQEKKKKNCGCGQDPCITYGKQTEGTRCWKGYEKKGMKTMFGKRVPNCVKREHVDYCVRCGNLLFSEEVELNENLKKWFKQKWVRFGPDGKVRGQCARGSSKEGKPKCLPAAKAYALGKLPGGFFKREGRPTTDATLVCRLIDRPLRPLFPKS